MRSRCSSKIYCNWNRNLKLNKDFKTVYRKIKSNFCHVVRKNYPKFFATPWKKTFDSLYIEFNLLIPIDLNVALKQILVVPHVNKLKKKKFDSWNSETNFRFRIFPVFFFTYSKLNWNELLAFIRHFILKKINHFSLQALTTLWLGATLYVLYSFFLAD